MKKGDIITLKIEDLAFGGKGIARHENQVVFIDKTFPGQTVEAQITKQKKNYSEGKLITILTPSPQEISHEYQNIPGAPWSTLPINLQHEYKKKQVFDLFQKFSGISLDNVFDTFVPSPLTWEYRNKMEYSFGPTEESQKFLEDGKSLWTHSGFGLGSKKRGQFWLVESLQKPSGIFDISFEEKIPEILDFCKSTNLPVFNQRTQEGFFRTLVVRKSFFQEKFLINLVTSEDTDKKFDSQAFSSKMIDLLGDKISGIFWSQSNSTNDATNTFTQRDLLFGNPTLTEKINDLEFEISQDSFFQTNPKSAENLYEKVSEYADLKSQEKCLDLFCGTGTIGQIIAKRNLNSILTGVEIVGSAVEDAQKNAKKNDIKNVSFVCDDVKKFLRNHQEEGEYSTIILDPPRAGIAPKSLAKVLEFFPEKLVYVSCNPATMARDTKTILEAGYQLQKFSLVDQFPHTSHVECVGKFVKVRA